MTESLTEKWKDGELPIGHYYVKRKNGMVFIDNTILQFDEMPITKLAWSDKTEEVLAPVPSYDEYKKLQEQLKDASHVILDMSKNNPVAGVYALDYKSKWGVK